MKKASTARSPVKKALDPNDSIADDVRKIKESMKKEPKATPAKKSREPAKSTPSGRASRSAKKEEKEVVKEETVVPEKSKPEPVNELKNELLADWMDDDDISDKPEGKFSQTSSRISDLTSFIFAELPPPKPAPTFEKIGESSRSIRNIPKKQRVSEVYIKAEPEKVVQPTVETKKPPTKESSKKSEDELKMPVAAKKTQKVSKRKHAAIEVADPTKLPEETDDSLFLATAELLNETEVPKVENAQLPSTFHKSNDIDKRNLPPKERNKRLLKASRESPAEANVSHSKIDNNGSMTKLADASIASPIQNELMLPHKKKQSSRLLTSDKSSPVLETRSARETKKESPSIESRTRKKRKSSEVKSADNSMEVETNSHEAPIEEKQEIQSPLREAVDVVNETNTSESAASATSNSISTHHRRGLKRRISEDSHQLTAVDPEICSEPKKLHKSDVETQAKTIIVACATETICISSKGQLSVSRRDSVVTTQANSVMVTSQVIISEATHQPIVVTTPSTDTTKPQLSVTVKLPQSVVKNALMIPPKELMEMKKQGLVTVGDDMKNKFTKKGKQIFKKITVETELEKTEKIATQPDQTSIDESAEQNVETSPEEVEPAEQDSQEIVEAPEDKSIAQVEDKEAESSLSPEVESNGALTLLVEVDESTNNNDIEKEPVAIVAVVQPSKETVEEPVEPELVENGKEAEGEEAAAEDPNNGGSGLIALQADSFGGPANCFYLCRAVDDRYEPVDNQILVLNAQNALVPYEGEDPLVPAENLAGFPQLSPNSNIIINTPNGQKIELNHFAIMALQEQADENGMASIESAGEQLELNINGIIEAITAQQEANDGENLIQGSVLIDGDGALILDTSEMPVEINHSATQVSETLSKPIMSAAVAPETMSTKTTLADSMSSKSLNIEDSLASIGVTTPAVRSNIPKCLELPITITNPTIAGENPI